MRPKLPKPKDEPWCAWCGAPLTQLRQNHRSRFCTASCRRQYDRDLSIVARRARQANKVCLWCKNRSLSKGRAYYCSSDCAYAARLKFWKDREAKRRARREDWKTVQGQSSKAKMLHYGHTMAGKWQGRRNSLDTQQNPCDNTGSADSAQGGLIPHSR